MADLPLAAPASADNETVILWAVGVLLVALGCIVAYLGRKIRDNENACKERDAKAEAERKAHQDKMEQLHQGALADQMKTQIQSNSVMSKVADALDRNTRVLEGFIQDEDTRTHKRRA